MLDWSAVAANRMFISDTGTEVGATRGGAEMRVARYAAWAPLPDGNEGHRVVEVSSDLRALMAKYDIPPDRVLSLSPPERRDV